MRKVKVKVHTELSTLGVDSMCMKMGQNYTCLIDSGNLVDLLAYNSITILEYIGFDSAVVEQ